MNWIGSKPTNVSSSSSSSFKDYMDFGWAFCHRTWNSFFHTLNPDWINVSTNNHIIFHQPNNHLYCLNITFFPFCFISTGNLVLLLLLYFTATKSEHSSFFLSAFSNKHDEVDAHSCSSKRTQNHITILNSPCNETHKYFNPNWW